MQNHDSLAFRQKCKLCGDLPISFTYKKRWYNKKAPNVEILCSNLKCNQRTTLVKTMEEAERIWNRLNETSGGG